MACGPPFMSSVIVVSGQRLLRDGAHPVGSHMQGQDEWHPLHFGVSPEWLWDSAPAISPLQCGLLQLRECSPVQSFPFVRALLGVTLKLVLRLLGKWGGSEQSQVSVLNKMGCSMTPNSFICFVGESVGVGRPCFLGWSICGDLSHPSFHLLLAEFHWQGDYDFFLAKLQARMAWSTER